jgi:hypothetical protein
MPLSCIPSSSSSNGSQSPRPVSTSSDAASDAATKDVAALWARLENIPPPQNWAFDRKQVAVNSSKVYCNRKNVIEITAENGNKTAIHANKIGPNTAETTPYYAAGQSPKQESLDNMLVQGIESGLGIYQFVSERAHTTNSNSSKKTILAMLNERHENAQSNKQPLSIAGKYKVTDFVDRQQSVGPYTQYLLTVEEIGVTPPAPRTIAITQAGFPFPEAVLSSSDIELARMALVQHIPTTLTPVAQTGTAQIHPLIVSHAGIGRNATLITYDRIWNLINSKNTDKRINRINLDDKLCELIEEGRLSRGPRFVHSREQLAQLRAALILAIEHRAEIANRTDTAPIHFHTERKGWFSRNPFKQVLTCLRKKPAV